MYNIDEYLIKNELMKPSPLENRNWYVYLHTVPKEIADEGHEMYYVGITGTSPTQRWLSGGKGYLKQPFYNYILKYGWENIQHEILCEHITLEEANAMEKRLIETLKSNDSQYGYNKCCGGNAPESHNRIDIIGKQFGRLTVLSDDPSNSTRVICECSCDNHTIKSYARSNLLSGVSQSCGCLQRELLGEKSTKHGLRDSPLYKKWTDIKGWCYNPKNEFYHKIGKNGIRMCDEWNNEFLNFYNWAMENGYDEATTYRLLRIDKNKDYEPNNCKWITPQEMINSRDDVKLYTFKGKIQNLYQWAKELGIKRGVLYDRINKYGYSIEEAFTEPIRIGRKPVEYEYNNQLHSISEWAEIYGIDKSVLYSRMKKHNNSFKDALEDVLGKELSVNV